jgi:hypothetical protein
VAGTSSRIANRIRIGSPPDELLRSELYQQRPPDGRKIRREQMTTAERIIGYRALAPGRWKKRRAWDQAGESGGSDENHNGANKNCSVQTFLRAGIRGE